MSDPLATEPDVAVRLERVGYRYRGGPAEVLRGASLEIRRGERVALIGPSGAGKSTLARIAVGLRRPSAGHLTILGMRDPTLASIGSRVGLVVQNPLRQLLAANVELEVAMGLRETDATLPRARVDDALERFGLAALRARHPLSLSEGQRRRVTLAAAFARRPELLVLDEPTLAQDETQRAALCALICELAAEGTAVLAITHDREFVNDACTRVATLREGRIVADLPLRGDPAGIGRLVAAGVPLADVPATVRELGTRGRPISARTVDELVAALR